MSARRVDFGLKRVVGRGVLRGAQDVEAVELMGWTVQPATLGLGSRDVWCDVSGVEGIKNLIGGDLLRMNRGKGSGRGCTRGTCAGEWTKSRGLEDGIG
ncbi:MAG: hypothetical protein HIU91_04625 [Acidobacteria bacterium]|nr:hypothetical protein [Acidobacteriota bacterium]